LRTGWVFAIGFLFSLVLTPAVRWFARRTGALKYPNSRSVHKVPIPHLGGVAIYLSSASAILLARPRDMLTTTAILVGGLVILVVGVIDDLLTLKPWQKVLGQILSALTVVYLGVSISFIADPFSGTIRLLDSVALPLTLLWVVSFENLINLSDGLDGLAAGIVGITALVIVLSVDKAGVPAVSPIAAAVAGTVLGFLPFNFHPATIFMGDGGAMYLGLCLAVLSIQGLVKSAVALAVLAPIMALLVPISDAAFAIIRRHFQGVPVLSADRDHIHHRLLEMGMGQRQAVLAVYAVSFLFGSLGVLSTMVPVYQSAPLAGLAVLGVFVAAYRAGVFAIYSKKENHNAKAQDRKKS